jgi:hypothetical protein
VSKESPQKGANHGFWVPEAAQPGTPGALGMETDTRKIASGGKWKYIGSQPKGKMENPVKMKNFTKFTAWKKWLDGREFAPDSPFENEALGKSPVFLYSCATSPLPAASMGAAWTPASNLSRNCNNGREGFWGYSTPRRSPHSNADLMGDTPVFLPLPEF